MSKVVTGIIDLPTLDTRDQQTLYDLILFLQENEIEYTDYMVTKYDGYILIKHKTKNWSYIKIYEDGRFEIDNHYDLHELDKDYVIKLLNEYYPMFRKALDILKENNITNYKFTYDKDKEKILIEIEEV